MATLVIRPFESGPARTPDFEDILHLVRDAVHAIFDESLRDDDDIFQAGADRYDRTALPQVSLVLIFRHDFPAYALSLSGIHFFSASGPQN